MNARICLTAIGLATAVYTASNPLQPRNNPGKCPSVYRTSP